MEQQLAEILTWLEPRAYLLALALPPVIRVVGHWIPEELFMIAMGVLAARSGSPVEATVILGAVLCSHFVTDQLVFLGGLWLRPRLGRFPRLEPRLRKVTARLEESPGAVLGLIPARVLPLGRGAWLAACGIVGLPWHRFAATDLCALTVHVLTWSGLGWWLAGDFRRLGASAEMGKLIGLWTALALLAAVSGVLMWRRRTVWQEHTARALPGEGDSLR